MIDVKFKTAFIGSAKATILEVDGTEYYLLYNGNAMFEFKEKYNASLPEIDSTTREGTQRIFDTIVFLAEQGEIARRYMGYNECEFLTVDKLRKNECLMQPHDYIKYACACNDSFSLGLGREVKDDDEEVDLGLQELQKKRN